MQRFTFDIPLLSDGLGFVPLALGLFGLTEIILNLESRLRRGEAVKVGRLLPTAAETKAATPAVLRGTLVGSILGVLPGGGALLASFVSYSLRRISPRTPPVSEKGRSRAWPPRNRRTTRARRSRSSPC